MGSRLLIRTKNVWKKSNTEKDTYNWLRWSGSNVIPQGNCHSRKVLVFPGSQLRKTLTKDPNRVRPVPCPSSYIVTENVDIVIEKNNKGKQMVYGCRFLSCGNTMTHYPSQSFCRVTLGNGDMPKMWPAVLQINKNTPVRALHLGNHLVLCDHFIWDY